MALSSLFSRLFGDRDRPAAGITDPTRTGGWSAGKVVTVGSFQRVDEGATMNSMLLSEADRVLALPAVDQLAVLSDLGCPGVIDELALQFHDQAVLADQFQEAGEITPGQIAVVKGLDEVLTSMSGQHNAALWTGTLLKSPPCGKISAAKPSLSSIDELRVSVVHPGAGETRAPGFARRVISGFLEDKLGTPTALPHLWADLGTLVKGASVGGPVGAIVGTALAGGSLIYRGYYVDYQAWQENTDRVREGQIRQMEALAEYRSGVEWKDRLVNMSEADFRVHKQSQLGLLEARRSHERSLLAEREKWWWDRNLSKSDIDKYLVQVRGDIRRNEEQLARLAEAERIRQARQSGHPVANVAPPTLHPEPIVFHAVAV